LLHTDFRKFFSPSLPITKAAARTTSVQKEDEAGLNKSRRKSNTSERWIDKIFPTMDDKIISFIDYLDKEPENQSQLILDFQTDYFTEHPMLSNEQIQRLLYGYLKKGGLLEILKVCHHEPSSVRTRTVFNFFDSLTDNNKCHQVDEFKASWKAVKPCILKECSLDILIVEESSLKDKIFKLVYLYLEGKSLVKLEDIIKHEIAFIKYNVWVKNKTRVQGSFASQTSSLRKSSREPKDRQGTFGRGSYRPRVINLQKKRSYEPSLLSIDDNGYGISPLVSPTKNKSFVNLNDPKNAKLRASGLQPTESGFSESSYLLDGTSNFDESSDSDIQVPLVKKIRSLKRRNSIRIQLPKDFFQGVRRDSEEFSLERREGRDSFELAKPPPNQDEEEKSQIFEHKINFTSDRSIVFEFDLPSEIKSLISKY